ncbi:MAG TPA: tRNA (adenosine(37)-N6)-threonylcarbamoyltransferase complex ATPase subunit type 1 TsaE [Candidatus Binatia bacterium]|jgi:tRNA threonylcarbamoyladenosine biosynthesis protein TsaE
MTPWVVLSTSTRMTMSFGRRLAKLVQGGEIIGLRGELGTGKTTFVRGFCAGIEVSPKAWVRSPTFTLINEYQGRLPVYHIDLYRIARAEEIEALNLREYLYSEGVSLIEWSERLPAHELEEYLDVSLAHRDKSKRQVTFTACGARYEGILQELKARE